MELSYGTQISTNALKHILQQTQQTIKNKQLQIALLPTKCQKQAQSILYEPFNAIYSVKNKKPLPSPSKINQINLKLDNRTPLKIKVQKLENQQRSNQIFRIDISTIKKRSPSKGIKIHGSATSNRKFNQIFNKMSITDQINNRSSEKGEKNHQMAFTSETNRKSIRTAQVSSRKNRQYFEIEDDQSENEKNSRKQDETKRKELFEKKLKENQLRSVNEEIHHKRSIYRKSLEMQFQAAKLGENKIFSINKPKQPIQIVSFEIQKGYVFTNQMRNPLRKTIQNIILLKYEQSHKDTIIKRNLHKEISYCKPTQEAFRDKEGQCQGQTQQQKFCTLNLNYNNSGRRQLSLIPYLSVNPGVKLSQKALHASISRNQPSESLNREKFIQSCRKKSFRSYSYKKNEGQTIQNNFMTIDVASKTHRVSKSTFHHQTNAKNAKNNQKRFGQTKDSFGESILWRPKTSRESNKIRLINQEYVKQLTVELV